MFQHILVPTDFSEESKNAYDIAQNIIDPEKGVLSLLHVIEIISDTTFEEFKSFYTALEKRSEKHLDEWSREQGNHRVTIEKRILYGNRITEIVRFAEDHHVDLIVLNSHKVDVNDPSRGWGTISYKVGILSQCPVLLVK